MITKSVSLRVYCDYKNKTKQDNDNKRVNEVKRRHIEMNQIKILKWSEKKYNAQRRLDKQIHKAITHCGNDKESPSCSILWHDVYDTLNVINYINEQTHLCKLYKE